MFLFDDVIMTVNAPKKHPAGVWWLGIVQLITPRQIGRHLTDGILRCILIKTSLKFAHKGPIDSVPALA